MKEKKQQRYVVKKQKYKNSKIKIYISKKSSQMRSRYATTRSYAEQQEQSRLYQNIKNNHFKRQNQQGQNLNSTPIEQIVETLNIYLRSATDLKKNIETSKKNPSHTKIHSFQSQQTEALRNKIKTSNAFFSPFLSNPNQNSDSELSLIIVKIGLFITNCQNQLKKINKTVDSSSFSQMENLGLSYQKVLSFIKERYSQLLKEAYRTLNMENMESPGFLTQEDQQILKQNRKRKLKQINELQKEMETLWNDPICTNADIHNISDINSNALGIRSFNSATNKAKVESNQRGTAKTSNRNRTQEVHGDNGKYTSFMVTMEGKESNKSRNLQVLSLNMENVNLRELAREELQKEFLSIRIQAYNMYEGYVSHDHGQFNESLNFLKEEQEILQSQVEEQAKLSQQLRQEYLRLRRQLSEVKTINGLIRKRYVVRESIRIDSEQGIYE